MMDFTPRQTRNGGAIDAPGITKARPLLATR
jgi:hypothetical protein